MPAFRSHEQLLRDYLEEVWGRRDVDAVQRYLHENYERHVGGAPLTRDQQRDLLRDLHVAFPDAEIDLEQVLVDGEAIAFTSTLRGTHRGPYKGIPPTGRRIAVQLVDFIRVQEGRFAEQWGGPDLLDLLSQLGAKMMHE